MVTGEYGPPRVKQAARDDLLCLLDKDPALDVTNLTKEYSSIKTELIATAKAEHDDRKQTLEKEVKEKTSQKDILGQEHSEMDTALRSQHADIINTEKKARRRYNSLEEDNVYIVLPIKDCAGALGRKSIQNPTRKKVKAYDVMVLLQRQLRGIFCRVS